MSCLVSYFSKKATALLWLLLLVNTVSSAFSVHEEREVVKDSIQVSDDDKVLIVCYRDFDADGYGNPSISFTNPVAVTCPGGYVSNNQDCNDFNNAVNPLAVETCNSLDDDCDGTIDDGFTPIDQYADIDGDGFGDPFSEYSGTPVCTLLPGFVANFDDCNDFDNLVFPGQAEDCNGADDNCDGVVDEGLPTTNFFADLDGDGFGDDLNTLFACSQPVSYVAAGGDCDDNDPFNFPGNAELCDGLDNDCDAVADNGAGADVDGDGWSTCENDCDDNDPAVNPGLAEICNGFDDNCNGGIDEGFDQDFDGFTICQNDCDELNPFINPSAVEICDGFDQNCDGNIDEGIGVTPTVVIAEDLNGVCEGTLVTFTATPTDGGSAPVYQWLVNGLASGTNASTFSSNTLLNGDVVSLEMTANNACQTTALATSNSVTMTITPSVTPIVNIVEDLNNVCEGTMVSFTATPTDGGSSPSYQWLVNGLATGTNAPTFSSNTLLNGDVVSLEMTANNTCQTTPLATSNAVTMVINTLVTPSVSIAEDANDVCDGTTVTFTATPTDGGSTPVYQWFVNGLAVGTDSPTFSAVMLNGDVVNVEMTANNACQTTALATSNSVTMNVVAGVTPTVVIAEDLNGVCEGTLVTFTATPTDGGSAPVYQWLVNGLASGTNASTFSSNTLLNGDVVSLEMTANNACQTTALATSNSVTMTITPSVTPSVNIVEDLNNVCEGTMVSFTATPTDGGSSPSYQWLVNGLATGTNAPTFSSNTLLNGDVVSLEMTANNTCQTTPLATSNAVTMVINTLVTPSVSIAEDANDVCDGTTVTFTATPTDGGSTPVYQWFVNGLAVGTDSPTFSAVMLNGDVVNVEMTANNACQTTALATSNSVTMNVVAGVTPTVVIAEDLNGVCEGTLVTFTATPTDGGSAPVYQWLVNGLASGTNASTFSSNALLNGDVVSLEMTANNACQTTALATSNSVTMTITPSVTPSVNIVEDLNNVCEGTMVSFTATPTDGGSSPSYQWLVNGLATGTNAPTFSSNTLLNGDVVSLEMTANNTCQTTPLATSNAVTMVVLANTDYYTDADGDGFGDISSAPVPFCSPQAGFADNNLDCNDGDALVNPNAIEVCNTIDDNCDGFIDEGFDLDGDGALSCDVDCDDTNPLVNGFLPEVCDGIDNNCDFVIDEGFDLDFDGVTICNGDCDDTNDQIFAGAPELCDGLDNDCNLLIDDGILVTPSVSIAEDANDVCDGTTVTFTATPTDGGSTPVYQWFVNGLAVGTDSPTFSAVMLNGDVVNVEMTANNACQTTALATSNSVTMNVVAGVTPTVVIAEDLNGVCEGTLVTFTATPTDGGSAPVYQWLVNGLASGTNASTFSSNALLNGDVVSLEMTANNACQTTALATSNSVTMTITPSVTPIVNIVEDLNNVCEGTMVSFTATPTDGGSSPSYQWLVNGLATGTNAPTFSSNTLLNGDVVSLEMTANNTCQTTPLATSNAVTMVVLANTDYYTDADGDGFGDALATPINSCVAVAGAVDNNLDCNDLDPTINPNGIESCNGEDDNCDGLIDEGFDLDGDGFTSCNGDCDDNNFNTFPGAIEICDTLDNDCNAVIDENLVYADYFFDTDLDAFGDVSNSVNACGAPPGYIQDNTDCNDTDASINPNAIEDCDGVDQDCDGVIDDGIPQTIYFEDLDGDGFGNDAVTSLSCFPVIGYSTVGGDCDDADAGVSPVALEVCNEVDDDCDGSVDDGVLLISYEDVDGDGFGDPLLDTLSCTLPVGYSLSNTDCDDQNPLINPGMAEICNELDENCDGFIDEGLTFDTYFADVDGDGFGLAGTDSTACLQPAGYVLDNTDCNDGDPLINSAATDICNNGIDEDCNGADSVCAVLGCTDPLACNFDPLATSDDGSCILPTAEICDAIDNDCNGLVDDNVIINTYFADNDGDGFGDITVTQDSCAAPSGYVLDNTDCDDADFLVNSGVVELCNTIDDNCDGNIDEGFDADADGVTVCQGDCDDTNPAINALAAEICDGLDNDCNGGVDEGFDQDFDGFTTCQNDCDDLNDQIFPGATEICGNGIDEDCDGIDSPATTYYADVDGDGFGDAAVSQDACTPPVGFVVDNTDCNDADALINPSATDICDNGIDEDCSGADSSCLVLGCTDPLACNFDPLATSDDGTCILPTAEICDAIDNDCNGLVDDNVIVNTYYADNDGDGFGDITVSKDSCAAPSGYVLDNTDCNDFDFLVNPSAIEACNTIDDNCDGNIDEGFDADADGVTVCQGDCDDTNPVINALAAEICDGLDNDCNGGVDEGFDQDFDGFTTCQNDCDDLNDQIFPGAAEICDGLDNNCDGNVDEGIGVTPTVSIASDLNNVCAASTITFTATPTDPGAVPSYQWQVNGINVGTDQASYSSNTFINGDIVTVVMIPDNICQTTNSVTSNAVTLTLTPAVNPAVSIVSDLNNICSGTAVNFTATPVDAGINPSFQWQVNGVNAGINSVLFSSNTLVDGDIVTVQMTATNACQTSNLVTSNGITMVVFAAPVTPSVSINSSSPVICSGASVTFTASPVNGGSAPVYQWQVNGADVTGEVLDTYITSSLSNNDVVSLVMIANNACQTTANATSNAITAIVIPTLTPAVTITSSDADNQYCEGTSVTFTAAVSGTGSNPVYQWQVNGIDVGTNSTTFSSSSLLNNDVVTFILNTSNVCQTTSTLTSNALTQLVNPVAVPTIAITSSDADDSICVGESVTFTAASTNAASSATYQWQLNGVDITGANGLTYTSASLATGDQIAVVLTPNNICQTASTLISNVITTVVNTTVIPSVSVNSSDADNSICAGESITFTAVPSNGGTAPTFQWLVNGVDQGVSTVDFTTTGLVNGDIVTVIMTPNNPCQSTSTASATGIPIAVAGAAATYFADNDGDGFGDPLVSQLACVQPSGYVLDNTDCDDTDFLVNSGIVELCNTIDDNCDGNIDEGFDLDADGVTVCQGDCDDTNPVINALAAEICDGLDNDCNGGVDEGFDQDFDGFTTCQNDCDDLNDQIFPGATEICGNGIDEDCDGIDSPATTYYADVDGDGFGDAAVSQDACTPPAGFVVDNTDCNDADATINTAATDICDNGIDEDCNGADSVCAVLGCTDPLACNFDPLATSDDGSCILPTAEICDAIDNDCNGLVDDNVIINTYFADNDGDGFGDITVTQDSCAAPSGYVLDNTDCDDADFLVNWGVVELCNTIDDNCDGNIDEGFDLDADGVTVCQGDCDDTNPAINALAAEICDGLDNDCNGGVDEGFDQDFDGFTTCQNDCDDLNDQIFPGATEICGNGIDEDCDGIDSPATTYYADVDGDGFGDAAVSQDACTPPAGFVVDNTDCNDADVLINPAALDICGNGIDEDCSGSDSICVVLGCMDPLACNFNPLANSDDGSCILPITEICDGLDNDCDGAIDNGLVFSDYYQDADGDLFGNPLVTINACAQPAGYVTDNSDCNDADATINTAAAEICDLIDNNCNTLIDDGLVFSDYYQDADGDVFGNPLVTINACAQPAGYVTDNTDCNDADPLLTVSTPEVCDGIDNDCDGTIDNGLAFADYYQDADGDLFGNPLVIINACAQPAGYVTDNTDCNDADGTINTAAAEICDGIDNNCNTLIDDGLLFSDYYQDADGDLFGNAAVVVNACAQPLGYVTDNTDCDDADATINTAAAEICDGIDNNCNTLIDDGLVFSDYYQDADGDLFGNPLVMINACAQPAGYVTNNTDCNDADPLLTVSTPEVCDGIDNDCDGTIDNGLVFADYYQDADGDLFGNPLVIINACAQPAGYVTDNTDCNDADPLLTVSTPEVCDGIDNDCDGTIDNGLVFADYYQDADGDLFGNPLVIINACAQPAGYVTDNTDCNDADATINTAAAEICDGIDNNCNSLIDDGLVFTDYYQDADGDLFGNPLVTINACAQPAGYVTDNTDCNDADPLLTVSTPEVCDGIDNDCDGTIDNGLVFADYYQDADGDLFGNPLVIINACAQPTGYVTNNTDCNDADATINTAAAEICDGIDNNCNTLIDDGLVFTDYYQDADGDLFGNPLVMINACAQPAGYVTNNTDCNDADGTINTAAAEICDGIDNNCNTLVDDGLVFSDYYQDADGDLFGNAAVVVNACSQPLGYVTNNTDCNDADAAINTAATEICDLIDNNCNTLIDDGLVFSDYYQDADGDLFGNPLVTINACAQPAGYVTDNTDCNDADPLLTVSTPEVCDGIDNDCDGTIDNGLVFADYYQDADGDLFGNPLVIINACAQPAGYVTDNTDCNDADGTINTAAAEICDGIDNNCNTLIDDGLLFSDYYQDADGDLFGNAAVVVNACAQPLGYVTNNTDCNDADATINTAAAEICDGIDNNCNTLIDDGLLFSDYYQDADGDLFGNAAVIVNACAQPLGYVTNNTDCNDADAAINTAATEICDGVDNNCNTLVDDGLVFSDYYQDADGDLFGNAAVIVNACAQPLGYVTNNTDCNDADAAINTAATEICDGVDNNCNTLIDEGVQSTFYADTDGDGFGDPNNTILACTPPAGYVADNTDCNDTDATINTSAAEICDLLDNNCDGQIDEGVQLTFYADVDGDGFGDPANTVIGCTAPIGYVVDNTDCNDADANSNPAGIEICDLVDNNCDGQIDEGVAVTPSVLITVNPNPVCVGSDVTFVATPTNPGTSPIYQWYVNGLPVGTNSDTFISNALINGDSVNVILTADNLCQTVADTVSNAVIMVVDSVITPIVSIVGNDTACTAIDVTYTMSITEPGTNPQYSWLVNGVDQGINSPNFTTNTLVNGDELVAIVNTSNACVPSISDSDTLVVTILDAVTPSVSLFYLPNDSICVGDMVNFQADTTNAGPNGFITWLVNGVPITWTDLIYSTDTLNNGDFVQVQLTSDNICQTTANSVSTIVTFAVGVQDTFYVDLDGDLVGDTNTSVIACFQPNGYVSVPGDCNDNDPTVGICVDADGDGYTDDVDCNDNDPAINPAATEICGNTIDENCDGINYLIWYWDADGDGFAGSDSVFYSWSCDTLIGFVLDPVEFDCNDADATVYQGAQEICDNLDNDCNSFIDDGVGVWWFYDGDLDGFGVADSVYYLCYPPSPYWTTNAADCDDTDPLLTPVSDNDGDGFLGCVNDCDDFNPAINPMGTEICDGQDNDCNGQVDEGIGFVYYSDLDGDGFGDDKDSIFSCDTIPPAGYAANNLDCDDANAEVNPSVEEICGNGIDDNCDGEVIENCIDENPDGFSPDGDGQGDEYVLDLGERDTQFRIEVYNRWGTKVFEASAQGRLTWDGKPNVGKQQEQTLPVGTYFAIIEINGTVKNQTITIWK